MIRVSVEVSSDVANFRAAVWAENIEHAVAVASAQYPRSEVRILFPIDPEMFFAGDFGAKVNKIQLEIPMVAAS